MKALNHLFLSCKKASELIEKKQEEKLTFVNSIQLKMHLSLCKLCLSYAKQSALINSALKKVFQQNKMELNNVNTDKLQERIIGKL